MIRERHPQVAERLAATLEGHPDTPNFSEAAAAARSLRGVLGFEPPSWPTVATGAKPEAREPEDYEPGGVRAGWQHEAASRVERHFRDVQVFHRWRLLGAIVRSQDGPGAGLLFACCPTSPPTSFSPQLFRVLLLRRLGLPLPLSRACRCGRPLDPGGHHRAVCARGLEFWGDEGLLWRACWRGFAEAATSLEHPPRSCGGWPSPVWRNTTCVGHDVGECTKGRWDREVQRMLMEWLWKQHERGMPARTQSLWEPTDEPV